jgi:hypothetical protein
MKKLAIHTVYGWETTADNTSLGLRSFVEQTISLYPGSEPFYYEWNKFHASDILRVAAAGAFDATIVIAHSYGGDRAKLAADELAKTSTFIDLGLFLDPVPRLADGLPQTFLPVKWHISPSMKKVLEFRQRNDIPRGVPFEPREGLTLYEFVGLQNEDGTFRHPGHCDIPGDPWVHSMMGAAIAELAGGE